MVKNEYISIPELAKILGISRIAVYKKVKTGIIPAQKIGRNYAIPKKYIQNVLGKELNDADRQLIARAIKKAMTEYGEVFKLLGKS
jgi:excisionase family DNA binding protein